MSSVKPTYRISFLPPPGPAVLSLRPPFPSHSSDPSIPQTFHDALAVRVPVFAIEQNCPVEREIDTDDTVSWHWVIHDKNASPSIPAATVRLIPAQAHADAVAGPDYQNSKMWDHEEPYAMIGRVATRREYRGRGYGRVLIEEALGWAGGHAGDMVGDWVGKGGKRGVWRGLVLIHAQVEVEGWYASIGWRTDEGLGRWDEEGIQHVGMWRRVEIKG